MKRAGKKVLAWLMALCLTVSMLPVTALAADGPDTAAVPVSTQEELKSALENVEVSSIVLTGDISLSFADNGAWRPITVEQDRTLVIDGAGYTISGLKVREYTLESSGSGEAGDGSSCDYYAGFIGDNKGNLTIRDLKFSKADVDMTPLSEKSTGSSILAVVCGNNTGTLVYENVDVDDSTVKGYTKVGILHGFTQQQGSFVADHCSVTNSTVVLEADGSDKDAAFSGMIVGYDGNNAAQVVNGIRLENNTCTVADSVIWDTYQRKTINGITYAVKGDDQWCLTSQTYCQGNKGQYPVLFPVTVDGYSYQTLEEAGQQTGSTVSLAQDVSYSGTWRIGENEDIVLDLSGHTLTFDQQGFIKLSNGGKLTVRDSGENGTIQITGTGTGIEIHGDRTYNEGGVLGTNAVESTLTLEKGTITSDGDATVKMFGNGATLNMKGGLISNTSQYTYTDGRHDDGNFAVAGNGTRNSATKIDDGGIRLNISGGEITSVQDCAIYLPGYHDTKITGGTIKGWAGIEIDSGNLEISGDTMIESTYTGAGVRNYKPSGDGNYNFGAALAIVSKGSQAATGYYGHMNIKIDGGTFVSPNYYAVDEYNLAHAQSSTNPNNTHVEKLEISNGKFSGGKGGVLSDKCEKFITGGHFTSDPTAYLAEGKLAVASDEAGYTYMVGEAPNVEVTVAEGGADVDEEAIEALPGDLSNEQKNAVKAAAESMTSKGLNALAGTEAQKVTEDTKEAGEAELVKAGIIREGEDFSLVVQSYLTVTPKAYDTTKNSLVLEIEPKCRVVATKAADPEDIVLDGNDSNAVVVEEKALTVTTPVEISAELPSGFPTDHLFVKHLAKSGVYYYQPTVENGTATFMNPHGFSEFTFLTDARTTTVSFGTEIGEKTYTPAAVSGKFPVPSDIPAGKYFAGWNFLADGQPIGKGPYTTLTDELLTLLADEAGVTAEAVFSASSGGTEEEEWKNPFTDVKDKDWFFEYVKYVNQKGLFQGTTDTTFSPKQTMERGMLVTVLYRLEGEPKAKDAAFTDVVKGAYYEDAVNWAAENKIVGGYGNGKFGPKDDVTREQLAAVLYRYAEYKGWDVSGSASLASFQDGGKASDWAVASLKWAVDAGILQGYGNGKLMPRGSATRAEVAKMLMQFCEKYIEK